MYINRNSLRRLGLIAAVVLALLVVLMILRARSESTLEKETDDAAIPVVQTMLAVAGPASEDIVLPGNVRAWHEATIYARTSGYIKKWYVDIGSRVKTGDLLAVIESPEIDAQLQQAEADLNTAIANMELAQATAKRWQNLVKSDFVSRQETDEKVSQAKALEAAVIAAQANRDRLKQLVSFERVLAPFDGVISSRSTDVGALINAGSGTTAVPLFHIVQTSPLRIYVQIPQIYVASLTADMSVSLRFTEHPGKTFAAKLFKTASSIDPDTRTLLAQFTTDNSKGELLPGGYTEVHLNMVLPNRRIHLPVNALLFRSAGLQVATVNKDLKVVLNPITISRDFGTEVEVDSGVVPGDRVVLNPPDSLVSGETVRLAPGA